MGQLRAAGQKGISLSCTFQQDADQGSAVTVLGLLDQQLPIIQHPRHWVPPLNDPIHDVAGIVLLVGSKCLQKKGNTSFTKNFFIPLEKP